MSKFLFFTDVHLMAKTPRHRIDNFSNAETNPFLCKLREVYELAETENVDCVCFGGDFFNNHRIFSYEIIDTAIEAMTVRTYGVIGQHDLKGHNMSTYRSSTLAHMERHNDMYETLWEPKDIGDAVLYPCHWFDNVRELVKQQVTRKKKAVLLAHQTITREASQRFETIPTSELSGGNFHLILSGDFHSGFDTHELDGTIFCNPSSLSRRAIDESDRVPKVVIVDVPKGKDKIKIREVPLKSARPGDEVFAKSFLEHVRKSVTMDASRFIEGVIELEVESADPFELIMKIGRQRGVRPEVLDFIASKKTAAA